MARGKRVEGKCRLCGAVGKLSAEHVPPRAAYNDRQVVWATQEQMLTSGPWDGRRGRVQQGGAAKHTLCVRCNNDTGAWYATEYVKWAKQGLEMLSRIPPDEGAPVFLPFRGRPLRFLKQVVTMFFSVNHEGFADEHPELVKFVLDRTRTGLPPEYAIDLVLVRGPFARESGLSVGANLDTGAVQVGSEVAHFPFAVRLVVEADARQRIGVLEPFAQFGFDEHREVWICTIAGYVATKYPGDYRSPSQVARDAGEDGI